MSDNLKSIVFVLVTALVCSLLLTGFSTGLMVPKQRNIQTDRQKNILAAVGLLTREQTADWQAIEQLYAEHIRCGRVDRNGQVMPDTAASEGLLPVCFQVRDGQVAAYILPVETKGLWGTIKGYLAIENDGATVTGFTVYSHQETPGLGGEIEKAWFQNNFKGKRIVDPDGAPAPLSIARGRADKSVPPERLPNVVDGISGASLTGRFLSTGFNRLLNDYDPLSRRFRRGDRPLPPKPDNPEKT